MAGQSPASSVEKVFVKWAQDNGAEISRGSVTENMGRPFGDVDFDTITAEWDDKSVRVLLKGCPQRFEVTDDEGMLQGKQTFQKSKVYAPNTDWDLRIVTDEDDWESEWEMMKEEDWEGASLDIDHKHGGERVSITPP